MTVMDAPRRRQPPFPFVWVPEETRVRPARHIRIRLAVWVLLVAALLAWFAWPVEPDRTFLDTVDLSEWE